MTTDRIRLPRLGFGAAPLGNSHTAMTDADAETTLDAAWSAGIRLYDTAPHYGLGLSERRLAAALAGRPRDEFMVSTKVGRLLEPSPDTADRKDDEGFAVPAAFRRRRDYSRTGVLRSVEQSLTRLGLDRLDIALVHDPHDHWAAASTEAVDALVELREQGVVGAVGVGMNQSAMLTRFVEETDVDVVMVAGRFTLLDQSAALDVLPAAAARGVQVIGASVYNSGLLSREDVDPTATFDYAAAPAPVVERARRIADVCARHGVTLPEAAVAFARRHPAVTSVVLGLRTPGEVAQAVERDRAEIPETLWVELAETGLVTAA